jgi:hypothetical protein
MLKIQSFPLLRPFCTSPQLALVSMLIWTWCFTSSCTSLIFGNVKPFEGKATNYLISDLSSTGRWSSLKEYSAGKDRVSSEAPEDGGILSDHSDLSYVSKSSHALISLNSACKNYNAHNLQQKSLENLTDELLHGTLNASSPISQETKRLTLERMEALKTTTRGQIGDQNYVIQTVVLRATHCVYDFILISHPPSFTQDEKEFSQFVASFRIQ